MKSQENLQTPHYDVIAVNNIIDQAEPLNSSHTEPEQVRAEHFALTDIPESKRSFTAPEEKQKVGRRLGSLITGRELVQTTANVHVSSVSESTPTTYNPSLKDNVDTVWSTRTTTVGKQVKPSLRVTATHSAKTRSQDTAHKTKPDTATLTESKSIELRDSLLPSVVERKVTYDGKGNVQVVQKLTTEVGRVKERIWSSDENNMHYHRSARRIASAVQSRVRASTKHSSPSGIDRVRSQVDKRSLGIARAKAKRAR